MGPNFERREGGKGVGVKCRWHAHIKACVAPATIEQFHRSVSVGWSLADLLRWINMHASACPYTCEL
eukprot:6210750-Pleurochrysis_carterae.AAC.3